MWRRDRLIDGGMSMHDSLPKPESHADWRPRQLLRRAMTATLPRTRFLVRGPSSQQTVCLTFDDGPHPQHTPAVLDVLQEHGVPATFFVIGSRVLV